MNQGYRLRQGNPINGFPRVAEKLASDPDRTTTIFRRFDRLSARNLLLLEAELAELEVAQDRLDCEDKKLISMEIRKCHSDWTIFETLGTEKDAHGTPTNPDQAKKFKLAMKIREKIKDYHEALALHQTLLNSRPPAKTTVDSIRDWFLGINNGQAHPEAQLWGGSATLFDDPSDLVALRVPLDQDRLSDFILNYFGRFLPKETSDEHSAYVRESSLATCVAVICSILAAILLFGSIISLYFVQNPYALLGMLGGWTVLFTICVGWLTNSRRDQIFTATAAYCAVLVVFVSGTLGGAQVSPLESGGPGVWNCTQIS